MSILEKAKGATGAAVERAAALKERASAVASDLTEQAAARASAVFDAGFDQAARAMADFNAALPIVREAGYTLGGVTIEVGLSPKVSASFIAAEALSDEQTERIAQSHADSKLAVMIIPDTAPRGQAAECPDGRRPAALRALDRHRPVAVGRDQVRLRSRQRWTRFGVGADSGGGTHLARAGRRFTSADGRPDAE